MALLSERQRRIIDLLAESPLTGAELARELGVSVRTVQADVSRINRGGGVVASSNRGYRLVEGPPEERAARGGRGARAPEADPVDIALRAIVHDLVKGGPGPTADDLGERLFMSRTAVERVLGEARERVAPYSVDVARERGRVTLRGDELGRRQLLTRLVMDEAAGRISADGFVEPLSKVLDLDFVRDVVRRCAHREERYVEPGYVTGLATSLAIALLQMRCPSGHGLARRDPGERDVDRRVALDVCETYARRWPIRAGAQDVDQIASLLAGLLRPTCGEPSPDKPIVGQDALIADIVRSALEPYGVAVEDGPALRGLVLHVGQLVRRAGTHPLEDDDLLEGIKRSCPLLFEAAQVVAGTLSERLGVPVRDGELGFLCVHLGLIMGERASGRARVALLSTTYQSVDRDLRDRLVRRFGDQVDVCVCGDAAEALDAARARAVDLVVTTRRLPDPSVPHVIVSPLLLSDDLLAIGRALRHHTESGRLARLRSMRSFFSERLFVRDDGPERRERGEVIDELCDRLREDGAVDPSFAASVRAREAAGSTCFFERFAIPHALDMNARRTAFCVLTSRAGVRWGGPVIHVVLMIAVRREDRERFMGLFDSTVRALGNPGVLPRLERARSLDAFLDALLER